MTKQKIDEIKAEIDKNDMDVITVYYSALDNGNTYDTELIGKSTEYSNAVTFILTNENQFNNDEAQEEFNRINNIINRNLQINNSNFDSVKYNAMKNMPDDGNLTI